MFQIAAAEGHAKRIGASSKHPAWKYNKYMLNPIDDSLCLDYDYVFDNIIHEDYYGFNFHYEEIPNNPNLLLHGFYQSDKYFDEHPFAPNELLDNLVDVAGQSWLHLPNLTAIHIRRGDYIDNYLHPVLDFNYYIQALRTLVNPTIICFSDDIDWCKKTISLWPNIHFVEPSEDIVDMYLMARCENKIIANSSFSWWSAKIGGGNVFAPKVWFNGDKLNTKDLYCKGWHIL